MAMDKEKLMEYFRQHYLSRQEVLFKLPLNISIDTFWPELLSRRKSRATILPLFNASGMPYWYVLTDRMIAASERLCSEAMEQEDTFDPYRMPMSGAMMEEMFFTSFVEGAQIPLQEAMDFLQRGTEPENIQEQMIWNNRHAWSTMIGSLYQPLDGNFIKALAYMLTEEMDNCAEDYRQADYHPIAAMSSEPYEVPASYSLPDRMAEYYAFLQSSDTHPLIKSAVGQAYILVARPFSEGNERLSRMISTAVLLRSGYDFFRDISISSVIAKESYRYYKCMQEILRSENDSDLTYFIEYYFDLLVRALESKRERERQKEQEDLIRERKMAREPLYAPIVRPSTEEEASEEEGEEGYQGKPTRVAKPWPIQSTKEFMDQVRKFRYSPKSSQRGYPKKVQRMLDQGLIRFTVNQWSHIQGVSRKNADYECRVLYQKGLTDRHKDVSPMEYSFRITTTMKKQTDNNQGEEEAPYSEMNGGPPTISDEFEEKLQRFEQSKSNIKKRTASAIRDMLSKGITTFYRNEWAEYAQLSADHAMDACDAMFANGMIEKVTTGVRPYLYQFTNLCEHIPPGHALAKRLNDMINTKCSKRDRRIGTFLIEMIRQKKDTFTSREWGTRFRLSKTQYGNDIRRASNLGFVEKNIIADSKNGLHYYYKICDNTQEDIRSSDLTVIQKDYLSKLYGKYARNEFSVEDMAKLVETCGSSAQFHLNNFAERGILNIHRHPGKATFYIFAVTSEDHPECFAQIGVPIEPKDKEKMNSEIAMAVASTAGLSVTA